LSYLLERGRGVYRRGDGKTIGYDNTTRGGDANRHRGKKFSCAMEAAMPAAALAAGGTRTEYAVDPVGKRAAHRHVYNNADVGCLMFDASAI